MEKDVHKISRVDDPRPKNPFLLYIRLVHNLGRDNCTYKNLKKKESKIKPQHTGHFKKSKRIKIE